MRQGTTPTLTIIIDDQSVDLTTMQSAEVYFGQDDELLLTKSLGEVGVAVTANTIKVEFTQEETFRFRKGNVKIQARFKDTDGHVLPLDKDILIPVEDLLSKEVME